MSVLFGVLVLTGLAVAIHSSSLSNSAQQSSPPDSANNNEATSANNLYKIFEDSRYHRAIWSINKTPGTMPLCHLTRLSGEATVVFSRVYAILTDEWRQTIQFLVFDPVYIDQVFVRMSSLLDTAANYSLSTQPVLTSVNCYNQLALTQSFAKPTNVTFEYSPNSNHSIRLDFIDQSFTLTLSEPTDESAVGLPMLLIGFKIVLLCLLVYLRRIHIPASKISLITLSAFLIFCGLLTVLEVFLGSGEETVSRAGVGISVLLSLVLCSQTAKIFNEVFRRIDTLVGYVLFYLFLFFYIFSVLNYNGNNIFLFLNSLILLPQIIHNARIGLRFKMPAAFSLLMFSNQIYILYAKGCPVNKLRNTPRPILFAALIVSMVVQLLFLELQCKLGPRFFIPKRWLPNYYRYQHKINLQSQSELAHCECPICLEPLGYSPGQKIQLETQNIVSDQQDVKTRKKENTIFKTPCNHYFHPQCLLSWMELSLQCPVDRMTIPNYM